MYNSKRLVGSLQFTKSYINWFNCRICISVNFKILLALNKRCMLIIRKLYSYSGLLSSVLSLTYVCAFCAHCPIISYHTLNKDELVNYIEFEGDYAIIHFWLHS